MMMGKWARQLQVSLNVGQQDGAHVFLCVLSYTVYRLLGTGGSVPAACTRCVAQPVCVCASVGPCVVGSKVCGFTLLALPYTFALPCLSLHLHLHLKPTQMAGQFECVLHNIFVSFD